MLTSLRTAAVLMGMCGLLSACGDHLEPGSPPAGEEGARRSGLGAKAAPASKLLRAGARGIPGQYIVVFEDAGAQSLRASPLEVRKAADTLASAHGGSIRRVYSHALKAFSASLTEEQALRMSEDPRVRYVEQDRVFTLDGTQIGPDWGLDRIDQRNGDMDNRYNYEFTGAGVHAYILDTGVRSTHTDFAGRMGNGFDSINDGRGTEDCQGHGTHVAGTVGGTIYGVAKGVTIHPVRVLSCAGEGTGEQVLAGMDWVNANHVNPALVNMSLGGDAEQAIDDAVANAIAGGITYVVAAGNESVDACTRSPARTPAAITVGATDYFDMLPYFSNFGSCVDLFAPGDSITSTWYTSDTATEVLSGTSMATPHVAGAVALYLEGHPTATPAEVHHEIVARSTRNAISDPGPDSPNVLLHSACMGSANSVAPQVTLTAPADGATLSGTVTFTATASDDVGVSEVEFYANGVLVGSDGTAPYSISWDSNEANNGPATLTARAFDSSCNSQDSSVSVTLDNAGRGVYSPVMRAPVCAGLSSQCDSWDTLVGRGMVGPEAHAPNTLSNSCADGDFGLYQFDPSLERLKVYSQDGGLLAGGKQVRIDAVVFASFDANVERLDLYSAADANAPVWTYITTLNPLDVGPNVLSTTFTLPNGSLQAIRGVYRYGGTSAPCTSGTMDDHDDLVFEVGYELDTQPPTATLTAPAAGATLTKTVTLSATASDNFGVSRVDFYDGTTLLGSDSTSPYSFSWDTRTAANGARSLTARAYDAAGFEGISAPVNVTVNNDTTAPTVAFSAPAEGATVTGSITVSATATDNVSVTKVELYEGTTLIATDNFSPYSFTWNTRTVANGSHTLNLKAYDAAGNIGTATRTVTTNNDFIAPTVALTAPTEGATLTGTVNFTATASDNVGVSKVIFFIGTSQLGIDTSAPYSYSYNTRLMPNGPKVITAKAYDAANNLGTSTAVNVTFDNDLTAPDSSITSPTNGATVSGVVTITAVASDDRGVVTKVEFWAGGTLLGTDTTEPYSWNWNTASATTGSWTLKTRAFDPAGNAKYSANVSVTVTR